MPMTTKQPPQQSPPTHNTFISTQAATLSTMKNQHEPTTEGESEEKNNGGVREKITLQPTSKGRRHQGHLGN